MGELGHHVQIIPPGVLVSVQSFLYFKEFLITNVHKMLSSNGLYYQTVRLQPFLAPFSIKKPMAALLVVGIVRKVMDVC